MNADPRPDDVFELTERLEIGGLTRLEMVGEPDRAVAVLRHALRAPKIRNRAGFAVANWNTGFDPRGGLDEDEQPVEIGAPTLEAIEHAWSLEPSPFAEAMLRAMAAALVGYGGFQALQAEFLRQKIGDG